MARYHVLIITPLPFRKQVLSDAALARLQVLARVKISKDGRNWMPSEIADRLPGMDAMLFSCHLAKFVSAAS